jgi:hypothetical protein
MFVAIKSGQADEVKKLLAIQPYLLEQLVEETGDYPRKGKRE